MLMSLPHKATYGGTIAFNDKSLRFQFWSNLLGNFQLWVAALRRYFQGLK